tara:strand:+ start:391 stop:813 length:423 start_codon:yes stop_codon:yes gene_type:complete
MNVQKIKNVRAATIKHLQRAKKKTKKTVEVFDSSILWLCDEKKESLIKQNLKKIQWSNISNKKRENESPEQRAKRLEKQRARNLKNRNGWSDEQKEKTKIYQKVHKKLKNLPLGRENEGGFSLVKRKPRRSRAKKMKIEG